MRFIKYLLLLVTCFLSATVAFSQEKKPGIISGLVKDARTKSPLNEAVITLSSTAYEGQKFALTDSTGRYSVKNLPVGTYTISFEMEGYDKYTSTNLAVKEGIMLAVDFEMLKEEKKRSASVKPAIYTREIKY